MIPEEMNQCVGMVDPPTVFEVEKGAVKRYVDAVGDDNPLYTDKVYADKSRYGGLIAPPGFFGWSVGKGSIGGAVGQVVGAAMNAGYFRILDGGISYKFNLPVRPGDTIIGSLTVDSIVEKESKSGPMYFIKFKTVYLNQNGDVVAEAYQKLICR